MESTVLLSHTMISDHTVFIKSRQIITNLQNHNCYNQFYDLPNRFMHLKIENKIQ